MLTLDFLNVGNADATLIRADDFTMLVDCADTHNGGDARLCRFLAAQGVSALDLLVISHLHADHTGALPLLAERFSVKALWTNYLPPAQASMDGLSERARKLLPRGMGAYLSALSAFRAQGTNMTEIGSGARTVALCPSLSCEVYGPGADVSARQKRALTDALTGHPEISELFFFRGLLNITSIRLALLYGASRTVLPGDLYGHLFTEAERRPCTIFRAPHHGSDASVDEALMAALSPEITVVSAVRAQKDDRPDPDTLALLAAHSGKLFVTGDAPGESVHIELP